MARSTLDAMQMGTGSGRWLLVATIHGSSLAGIDATVVGIALPTIGADLGAPFAGLQWTVSAYTLTLAPLILWSGDLCDRFGRQQIFVSGVALFTVGSARCSRSSVWAPPHGRRWAPRTTALPSFVQSPSS